MIESIVKLTSTLCVLAQLELHASIEFSGDQAVGYHHHNPRDEEEDEEQQHIPEKQAHNVIKDRKINV